MSPDAYSDSFDDEAYLNPPYPLPFALPNPFLDALIKQCDDAIETLTNIQERYSWPITIIPGDGPEITWRDPEPILLEARRVNIETLEIATGSRILQLCERPIPAKGTE